MLVMISAPIPYGEVMANIDQQGLRGGLSSLWIPAKFFKPTEAS